MCRKKRKKKKEPARKYPSRKHKTSNALQSCLKTCGVNSTKTSQLPHKQDYFIKLETNSHKRHQQLLHMPDICRWRQPRRPGESTDPNKRVPTSKKNQSSNKITPRARHFLSELLQSMNVCPNGRIKTVISRHQNSAPDKSIHSPVCLIHPSLNRTKYLRNTLW